MFLQSQLLKDAALFKPGLAITSLTVSMPSGVSCCQPRTSMEACLSTLLTFEGLDQLEGVLY